MDCKCTYPPSTGPVVAAIAAAWVMRKEPTLGPAPDATPIERECRHASFDGDDDTHYAALSYVWGRIDENTVVQILINGHSFLIGSNLHAALKQLFQNGVRSWLWEDSICINQSDMEEKSLQVAQMHTIFSRAECVFL